MMNLTMYLNYFKQKLDGELIGEMGNREKGKETCLFLKGNANIIVLFPLIAEKNVSFRIKGDIDESYYIQTIQDVS